jgi:hypothetical protein
MITIWGAGLAARYWPGSAMAAACRGGQLPFGDLR